MTRCVSTRRKKVVSKKRQDYFLIQEKKFLIFLKTKYFQQTIQIKFKHLNNSILYTYANIKSKHKTYPLKLSKHFVNEIGNYLKAKQAKRKQIGNPGNCALIDLKNTVNKKEIS